MPKPDKDISGKIVDFLREKGGEAEIGLIGTAKRFNSHPGTISHILERLSGCGIIRKTAEPNLTGTKRPARYALDEQFKGGDSWREALKRKSSGGKAETGPSVIAKPSEQPTPTKVPDDEKCHSEECLKARKVFLEELVDTFERLKISQEENQVLSLDVEKLQKEVGDLRNEAEKRGDACHKLRNDVDQLKSRLLTLRAKTSQLPATGRKLKFDDSGAVILPGERLPDRS